MVLGDARLSLGDVAAHSYDLIFADAFSSDAVPVHLLTEEALAVYLDKLADHGVLVVNITNRYLDLEPVLAALAERAGLVGRIQEEVKAPLGEEDARDGKIPIDEKDVKKGKAPSRWVVLARAEADLGGLANQPKWRPLKRRSGVEAWNDRFSSIVKIFR